MCGIFGVVGMAVERELAQACTDRLTHRGPDGSGLWQEGLATLGHRRLSILDLSERGRQPMAGANGRYWITFNGEIYNFVELRRELEGFGHRFTSESDTEVILVAFEHWGEGCQDRFNGMWALAIWDTEQRRLFFSRDRFGKKPLFYCEPRAGGLAFASEMKALVPLIRDARINVALAANLGRIASYEGTEDCLVEGIRRFPAGHCGWWHDGRLTLRRWWNTLDHLHAVPADFAGQVELFRDLFLDACRLRMRSDVPLGTALSGGLDSSATVCAMAHLASQAGGERMGENWQHAVVASFPGTPLDEVHYARQVTDHIGIEPHVVEISPDAGLDRLDEYLYLFEEIWVANPIPFCQTYRAVKDNGVTVTLDGHGADELLGGYNFDFIHALDDAGWNPLQASQVLDAYYDIWPKGSSQFQNLPPRWLMWLKRRLRTAIRPPAPPIASGHPAWDRFDHLGRQLYVSSHASILPTLLRCYDRYSMASGVEIRMPFMDHRLVTLSCSLPWTAKLRGGFTKAIVRHAMAPYMPEAITWRKSKIGFNPPMVNWIRGPMRGYLLDTLASTAFRQSELIDAAEVERAVRRVLDAEHPQFHEGERAWTLLAPHLWEKAFMRRAAQA